MKTSKSGANKIKLAEGLRLKAYGCQAGVPTIGYGHTRGVNMGKQLQKQRLMNFLKRT